MKKEMDIITVTVAQCILDHYVYSHDKKVARMVARDAGMFPISKKDAKILKDGMGEERFCDFKRACQY